jgi:uncharacterized protein YggU (UPF0235/DUF167 family)
MLIKVKVFPNSKEEKILKKSEDDFEIKVKEKPKEGKANEKVKKILAKYLKISEEKLVLIRGRNKQNKIFRIFK